MPLKPGCSLMQSIYKGQCLIKDKDNKLHCHGEVMTFADMSLFTLKCFSQQNTELRQLLGGCTFLEAFFFFFFPQPDTLLISNIHSLKMYINSNVTRNKILKPSRTCEFLDMLQLTPFYRKSRKKIIINLKPNCIQY